MTITPLGSLSIVLIIEEILWHIKIATGFFLFLSFLTFLSFGENFLRKEGKINK